MRNLTLSMVTLFALAHPAMAQEQPNSQTLEGQMQRVQEGQPAVPMEAPPLPPAPPPPLEPVNAAATPPAAQPAQPLAAPAVPPAPAAPPAPPVAAPAVEPMAAPAAPAVAPVPAAAPVAAEPAPAAPPAAPVSAPAAEPVAAPVAMPSEPATQALDAQMKAAPAKEEARPETKKPAKKKAKKKPVKRSTEWPESAAVPPAKSGAHAKPAGMEKSNPDLFTKPIPSPAVPPAVAPRARSGEPIESTGGGAIPALPLSVIEAGGVKYITGGVGYEEETQLKSLARDFNTQIMLTGAQGEYLSGAMVRVLDDKGAEIISADDAGPYFYAQLPPGSYTIEATARQGGIRTLPIKVNGATVKQQFRFSE